MLKTGLIILLVLWATGIVSGMISLVVSYFQFLRRRTIKNELGSRRQVAEIEV